MFGEAVVLYHSLQIVSNTNTQRSQPTANILLRFRRLPNPDHPILHNTHHMRPVWRPATAVIDTPPD